MRLSRPRTLGFRSTIKRRNPLRGAREVSTSLLSGAGGESNGTTNRKVDPWPGMLSTHISPPMSCTRPLLIARPSPVPPYSRLVELSA